MFDVVKARKRMPNAFAVIESVDEITVVIDDALLVLDDVMEIEKGWKLLTFDAVLPFGLVGFLASVSKALADAGVSIFALSAYSTDHVMVKEADLEKALEALKSLGCDVKK